MPDLSSRYEPLFFFSFLKTSLFWTTSGTFVSFLSVWHTTGAPFGLQVDVNPFQTASILYTAAMEYLCHTVSHSGRQWHCDAKVLMLVAFSRGSLLDECNF